MTQRVKRHISPNAKSGIALPIIRIDGVDYDLEAVTIDQLMELRVHLEEQIRVMDLQLSNAAAKFNTTGERSDPQWFNNAQFARKMKGAMIQGIQMELSKRKRNHADSVEKRFVDAARQMLSKDTFAAIMRIATAE